MPTEQDIREICERVTLAQDEEHVKAALTELKIAIREHITDAENRGIHFLLTKPKVAAAGSEE